MTSTPRRLALISASPVVRRALRKALRDAPDLALVLDTARGADVAARVASVEPHVVVVDTYLPDIDAHELTRELVARCALPVVLLDEARDERAMVRAYAAGAVHLMKPPVGRGTGKNAAVRELLEMIRHLAASHDHQLASEATAGPPRPDRPLAVVGITSSAGGPPALQQILSGLAPEMLPPLLLVQHLAPGFHEGFADWLAQATGYTVALAEEGTARRGVLYLGLAGTQFWVDASGALVIEPADPHLPFTPSGDHLFARLAREHGPAAAGIVLSGMGVDGAEGALALRKAGGTVLVQGDATIDGMPAATVARGAASAVLPAADIRSWLMSQGNP